MRIIYIRYICENYGLGLSTCRFLDKIAVLSAYIANAVFDRFGMSCKPHYKEQVLKLIFNEHRLLLFYYLSCFYL